MEYSNKCFGQALKEIMEDNKIKSRSLASKTNLDFSYFSKLKKREKRPPIQTIEIIAGGLNVPAEYFLEYRIYIIKKLLLDSPELIDKVLAYISDLINESELKVAERKTKFTKK